ncbi:MAG: hypothetical protein JW753_01290 [Dehalococcoidia bacterium]|nr:hypothetical protein [Dehalococcoidia bacterium]
MADPADYSSRLNPGLKYDDSPKELLPIRAHAINAKMKATRLKLPPRMSKYEVHCQWEFRVEE